MSDTIAPTDAQRQLAAYDRELADTRKLIAESDKFAAEQRKLAAEALHLERQRGLAPWAIAAGAAGGAIAGAGLLLRLLGLL